MSSALILHGRTSYESYTNPDIPKPHKANWLPWLSTELAKRSIVNAVPPFPEPFAPDYTAWKSLFERYDRDRSTSIITHDIGAEFALRWLSENKSAEISRLVLVAPWQDIKGEYGDFSEYTLDDSLSRRISRISLMNSVNYPPLVQDTVHRITTRLSNVQVVDLKSYTHSEYNDMTENNELPEVLEEAIYAER